MGHFRILPRAPDVMAWEGHSVTFVTFLPKTRKGTSYKVKKYLKIVKVTKSKKRYWNHDRLQKMKYDVGPGLDLEPGKTHKSNIPNKVWLG